MDFFVVEMWYGIGTYLAEPVYIPIKCTPSYMLVFFRIARLYFLCPPTLVDLRSYTCHAKCLCSIICD